MEEFIKKVEVSGLKYKVYPQTKMINVTDVDNVVQSYYCSTGTTIFRDGNDTYKSHKHIERDMSFDRFLSLCRGDEDIIETFF